MRMGSRQRYRTMARMKRRRSYPGPEYTEELEKLAKLRDEGVISDEDFEAKKNQVLGL
jgi:Short C-terminal domain